MTLDDAVAVLGTISYAVRKRGGPKTLREETQFLEETVSSLRHLLPDIIAFRRSFSYLEKRLRYRESLSGEIDKNPALIFQRMLRNEESRESQVISLGKQIVMKTSHLAAELMQEPTNSDKMHICPFLRASRNAQAAFQRAVAIFDKNEQLSALSSSEE